MRALLGLGLLALVGCSSPQTPALTLDDLATRAGCTRTEAFQQAMTREAALCTVEGGDVFVATFTDNAQRDQWLTIAPSGGGVLVSGDQWAVQVLDLALAESLAATLDGKVVS